MDYFMSNNTGFVTPSWALGLLVLWIIVLIAAIFWQRARPAKNPVRQAFRKRTTTVLFALAGLAIAQLVTRIIGLDFIEWRLWTYLLFFAGLGYGLFAFNAWRTQLPVQSATARMGRSERPVAMPDRRHHATPPGTQPAPPAEPRPEPITARRDARRAKKKR